MKKNLTVFFLIYFFSSTLFATNIRTADLEKIIQNNKYMISLFDQINNDQEKHTQDFNFQESQLETKLDQINELRLILENTELEKEINIYNEKLNNFNLKIEKFNNHYELQVSDMRNILINNILQILKKYSFDNKIDLILDANNYILSSNSIDITDIMIRELNTIEIEFKFKKYE